MTWPVLSSSLRRSALCLLLTSAVAVAHELDDRGLRITLADKDLITKTPMQVQITLHNRWTRSYQFELSAELSENLFAAGISHGGQRAGALQSPQWRSIVWPSRTLAPGETATATFAIVAGRDGSYSIDFIARDREAGVLLGQATLRGMVEARGKNSNHAIGSLIVGIFGVLLFSTFMVPMLAPQPKAGRRPSRFVRLYPAVVGALLAGSFGLALLHSEYERGQAYRAARCEIVDARMEQRSSSGIKNSSRTSYNAWVLTRYITPAGDMLTPALAASARVPDAPLATPAIGSVMDCWFLSTQPDYVVLYPQKADWSLVRVLIGLALLALSSRLLRNAWRERF